MAEFPIVIVFKPEEVEGASKDQIRDLLLDRSADKLFQSGTAPLQSSTAGSGNVGRFTLDVAVDRAAVAVGDAVTLTLTVRGSGNVRNVVLPSLPTVS
jgi:hypothetical protein